MNENTNSQGLAFRRLLIFTIIGGGLLTAGTAEAHTSALPHLHSGTATLPSFGIVLGLILLAGLLAGIGSWALRRLG